MQRLRASSASHGLNSDVPSSASGTLPWPVLGPQDTDSCLSDGILGYVYFSCKCEPVFGFAAAAADTVYSMLGQAALSIWNISNHNTQCLTQHLFCLWDCSV